MKKCIPIFLLAGMALSLPSTGKVSNLSIEILHSEAQQQTIKGKVVDGSGNPIENATVAIQGTNRGTATDAAGRFSIESPKQNPTLLVSYVGFNTKTFQVKGDTDNVLVQLDNKNDLDEVVVVGYGTQKKVNLTGAVSQVTSEVLENRPASSLSRMLQGALPNLNLKMVDGSPTRGATFNVRGTTSIGAGGSALVLIDGVEGDPNMINPNDIESVTVLKDASSAAIYGSRAAFGVVLITTKSPKAGKATVTYNSNFSINYRVVEPKLVTNGYQWAKNFNDAFNAWYDYKSTPISVNNVYPFSLEYLEALRKHDENPTGEDVVYNKATNRYEYFGNTDWYNLIYRNNMPATEQAMSVSGGGEKASYFLSGRYFHQGGLFQFNPDKFNKYNIRGKGDIKVTDWLTFQNNTEISSYDYHYPMFADGDGNIWRQFEHQGYPMAVIHNPDGSYTHTAIYTGVASFMEGTNASDLNNTVLRNTAGVVIKPLAGLTLKGDLTYSRTWQDDTRTNNFINYSNSPGVIDRFGRSLLRQLGERKKYLAANITANYQKKFADKHEINALLGYNVEEQTFKNLDAQRDGIILPDKPDFNLMDGLNFNIVGGGNEWAYMGLFYRFNYAYDNKYLLELNGRYDGSSKFPENQRFGFFPSVSAGWVVSNESFFEEAKPLFSNMKFRASYGSLGNGNINPYRYQEQMSVAKTGVILGGVQPSYTSIPGVIPEGLTWERSTTFNVGADVGFFDNALNVTFDWYNRQTYDMFTIGEPLPSVFGAAVPYGNFADLSTKGWELTVNYNNQFELAGKPFNWGINGSLWDSKSHITRFNNPNRLLNSYYVGQEVGEIWGYQTLGFFTSEDDVKNHADQSFIRNSNNNVWLPGDLKFADLPDANGQVDGVINSGDNTVDNPGDRRIIGNNSPRYQYGFTLSGRWNGIGLSAFFQGIGKRDYYFAPEAGLFWGPYNRPYGYQPTKMMEDMWSEENPDAYFPRYRGYTALGADRSLGAPQTRYLQDISYLRVKNISLDYNIPQRWLQKSKLANVQVFVSGQNLFTFSGLFKHTDNFDPEVIEKSVGDLTNGSGEGYAYPQLKTYTFGLNVTF
ncbi:SusC/RagA family TonB-linked outer membrane protein [Sphingobacterium sp. DK4209]|uniref:SusC/RagA family TonB-linked outer membrane protein n=1 Tax=Sphingobacterium zhuxiongii TaxID=2662364 RepID=A0A5Q0QH48_9SPHI|nr:MULTISPECIES: TonB-dependent receptor [unclassified Sphingobacterium]MVZ67027.1 SusC/RagA family TonB-linked outer membrane protein [Sphingobacterium sp. DK4209]QGA26680.1 SusC/RagA family TonB-linked outer membrane protein [Sphingobacterium sp. dk4302]